MGKPTVYYSFYINVTNEGVGLWNSNWVKKTWRLLFHIVSKGLISRESNRSFSLLFERRHSSDYDDFAYATSEEVDELLPKAQAFISEIERLLWWLVTCCLYWQILPEIHVTCDAHVMGWGSKSSIRANNRRKYKGMENSLYNCGKLEWLWKFKNYDIIK